MTEQPEVVALATLQFHVGGLFDAEPVDGYAVHLVRYARKGGTPGPVLCEVVDRFGKDSPGWSVCGGVESRDPSLHVPCVGCRDTAKEQFPGLPILGIGAKQMAAALDVDSFESWSSLPKSRGGHGPG